MPAEEGLSSGTEPSPRRRRSAPWLLLVPFAAVLVPAVYAHERPRLGGIPFFIWYQFACVLLGAAVTGLVYWLRGPSDDDE